VHARRTSVRVRQRRENPNRRALPCTIGPEQSKNLAAADGKRNPGKRLVAAGIRLREILNVDRVLLRHRRVSSSDSEIKEKGRRARGRVQAAFKIAFSLPAARSSVADEVHSGRICRKRSHTSSTSYSMSK